MNINMLSDYRTEDLSGLYAELKKFDVFRATIGDLSYSQASALMEEAGFAAINVDTSTEPHTISGIKAKDGECFETGRSAFYKGYATAAVDDDNHLVFNELRVCEKTATVYKLPPYSGIIEITDADEKLLATLETEPVPFDCNTYEVDLKKLLALTDESFSLEGDKVNLLYKGPFRLLILKDGTIIRRGEITELNRTDAEELLKEGGEIYTGTIKPVSPPELHSLYKKEGSAVLMNSFPVSSDSVKSSEECDIDALNLAGDVLIDKIRRMLDSSDRYFILTGSSPSDPDGCCPSLEVGEAEKLVKAGILSSFLKPAPPDSCPVTIFAINGEIANIDGRLSFNENIILREKLADFISRMQSRK